MRSQEVNFIVVERPGYPAAAAVAATPSHLLPSHYRRLELPHSLQLCLTSLSSTELRARIQGGGAAAGGEADCVGQDWALAGLLPVRSLVFLLVVSLFSLLLSNAAIVWGILESFFVCHDRWAVCFCAWFAALFDVFLLLYFRSSPYCPL